MRKIAFLALGAAAAAAAARFATSSKARTQAYHAKNKMKGVAHTVTPHRHEEMDDQTLADRVRSEIFRAADAPKGSVSVDVQAGVAYLRGEVSDQAWIDRLGSETRKVQGINGVKNLLHTPGMPTPTAEPRSVAAENFKG
jgi:osmotically-inducible protein OsmY